jgi:DNA-binding transcriptional ArsR family regulator
MGFMIQARFEENARLLKALAHPTRLHIVMLIREQKPRVKIMEGIPGVSQPNLSQHLSLLRNIGVVEAEREGNQVCYKIKNKLVLKLLDALSQ